MPKPLRQKKPMGSRAHGSVAVDHISDPRFTNIQTDPRFRLPSRKSTHVEIDRRFARMLHDEEFSSRAKVDRYGRKLPKDAGKKELERYYRIGDEEGKMDKQGDVELESDEIDTKSEGRSASSPQESSSDQGSEDVEEDEVFGFPDEEEPNGEGIPMGEPSSRLAVVNLDWDNIRAADLLAVFSSFVPSKGHILKVSVYPSEFGKARMEREDIEGPPKEIFRQRKAEDHNEYIASEPDTDEEDVDGLDEDERIKKSLLKEDQGLEFNSAKLRRYQLERLRYYYAVLTCSSTAVAQAIYDAVDGTEYLTTANFFDLRFISNEVTFLHDTPRDECEIIPDGYRPNDFVTDALQHSKVRLTWDADNGARKEAQKRAFTGSRAEMDENDLKAYLGSDSSDEELNLALYKEIDSTKNDPEQKSSKKEAERQKMRELLGLEKERTKSKRSKTDLTPVGDMQITFSAGLSSEPKRSSVFENDHNPDPDPDPHPERHETTVEKYMRKERERKSRRREKMLQNRTAANNTTTTTTTTVTTTTNTTSEIPSQSPTQDLGFSDPFFTASSSRPHARPKKKRKLPPSQESGATTAAAAAADDDIEENFEMDVRDPRFEAVYERSEFAIDPLHKGFKGTEGMKRILEEGRKRRKRGKGGGEEEEDG